MSTGQKIQRASDDPTIATTTLTLNSELAANDQYSTNITDATNWLDTTDSALSEAGNVLSRIRELMVKSGNGSYGTDEISTIKDEVISDVKQLGQILNTSYDGSYIFGGTKSTSKAVTVSDDGTISYAAKDGTAITDTTTGAGQIAYNQISSDLTTEISDGVKVAYNKTASGLLQFKNSSGSSVDASEVLSRIIGNLGLASSTSTTATTDASDSSGALTALSGTNLTELDSIIDNFTAARSSVGTTQNRMESAATTNSDQTQSMTSVLSSTADVDYAQASVTYSSAQQVYKAALQVSSKVLEKTLLDYL
jgi:flagellar hook-associated protein 3 FlgL